MSMSGESSGYGYDPPIYGPEPRGLQLGEAYSFVFQNPNWGMNLLLGTVCQLIPVVGPIVFLGYEYELIEALHRDPRRTYPDFDFNRFTNYLTRGLWPFLVALIVSLVLVPVIWLAMAIGFFALASIGAAAGGNQAAGPAVALVCLLMFVGIILLSCAMSALIVPVVLRAGLTQDFAAAFNFEFFKDFLRRMWLETLIAAGFIVLTGIPLMLVGMLLCIVGMYPAMTLMLLAQTHLHYQLYELYLERGGQPIPLKEPAAA